LKKDYMEESWGATGRTWSFRLREVLIEVEIGEVYLKIGSMSPLKKKFIIIKRRK